MALLSASRITSSLKNGPSGSRFLSENNVTQELIDKLVKLNQIAKDRDQDLAQLALVWALHTARLTSVLIGASKPSQVLDNIKIIKNLTITDQELKTIDSILA